MDRLTILRTMVIGFGLLVLLVLATAIFGYRQSREIQANAQELVHENLPGSARVAALEARIVSESEDLLDELLWILGSVFALAIGGSLAAIWLTNRALLRLERQTAELNQVSWQLLDSQENTARRFSHEMHDELGQALTGLKSMLRRAAPADFDAQRPAMTELLDEAVSNVRELSQLLRPVILDDFGLDAGIAWLVERFSQRTRIETAYSCTFSGRLPDAIETHLFRIAQEALTNIARHSGAVKATVRLDAAGATVSLVVEDQGSGMDLDQPSTGKGMVGIRARVRQLEGKLRMVNRPEGGLRIEVSIPHRDRTDPVSDATNRTENPHPAG